MGVLYATLEQVKGVLDSAETARNNTILTDRIEAASRGVERLLHRPTIAPTLATRYFDWPDVEGTLPWRLWLNQHEIISTSAVVAGGTTLAVGTYNLEPANDGPPYDRLEVDISSASAFSSGSTHQRAIAVTGLFGYTDDSETAGTLAAAISTAGVVTVTVSDSSAIGVGTVLKVDSERLQVKRRTMVDTSQTATALTAAKSAVSITVASGAALAVDEMILVDSERMRVVDIAGNVLTVDRAVDGSVLAAHSGGASIYAPRLLTVSRAALGTTAATHSNGAALTRWVPPGPITDLTIAEVLHTYGQQGAGYARTIGSGEGQRNASMAGIADIRRQVYASHGRKARTRAV